MPDAFLQANALLADRGHDADWFREAPAERSIGACIPLKGKLNVPIPHDRVLSCQRHEVESTVSCANLGALIHFAEIEVVSAILR